MGTQETLIVWAAVVAFIFLFSLLLWIDWKNFSTKYLYNKIDDDIMPKLSKAIYDIEQLRPEIERNRALNRISEIDEEKEKLNQQISERWSK